MKKIIITLIWLSLIISTTSCVNAGGETEETHDSNPPPAPPAEDINKYLAQILDYDFFKFSSWYLIPGSTNQNQIKFKLKSDIVQNIKTTFKVSDFTIKISANGSSSTCKASQNNSFLCSININSANSGVYSADIFVNEVKQSTPLQLSFADRKWTQNDPDPDTAKVPGKNYILKLTLSTNPLDEEISIKLKPTEGINITDIDNPKDHNQINQCYFTKDHHTCKITYSVLPTATPDESIQMMSDANVMNHFALEYHPSICPQPGLYFNKKLLENNAVVNIDVYGTDNDKFDMFYCGDQTNFTFKKESFIPTDLNNDDLEFKYKAVVINDNSSVTFNSTSGDMLLNLKNKKLTSMTVSLSQTTPQNFKTSIRVTNKVAQPHAKVYGSDENSITSVSLKGDSKRLHIKGYNISQDQLLSVRSCLNNQCDKPLSDNLTINLIKDGNLIDLYKNPTAINSNTEYDIEFTSKTVDANQEYILQFVLLDSNKSQIISKLLPDDKVITAEIFTTGFTSISAGTYHTCGIRKSDGQAFCWGLNNLGQLGDGQLSNSSTPIAVKTDVKFSSISAGNYHTCALTTNGDAYCWGYNFYGQLGNGQLSNSSTPTAVKTDVKFSSISAGYIHTCGIRKSDGKAFCWGHNSYGELGDGSKQDRTQPGSISINGDPAFTSISARAEHTCGIRKSDGQAFCWGYNVYGQLGDGSKQDRTQPVSIRIDGDPAFTSISVGYHTCGIRKSDGQAFCWGLNAAGQLGNGGTASNPVPSQVKADFEFSSISAGSSYTCGVRKSDEQAYCWGSNTIGQLGDETLQSKALPTKVSKGIEFSSISAGGEHACGIRKSDRKAFCWGNNLYGQFGDGSVTSKWTPTPVLFDD